MTNIYTSIYNERHLEALTKALAVADELAGLLQSASTATRSSVDDNPFPLYPAYVIQAEVLYSTIVDAIYQHARERKERVARKEQERVAHWREILGRDPVAEADDAK